MDGPRTPEATPLSAPGTPDAPRQGRKRRRSKGVLAHLPPVPDPIDVEVKGLTPKKAFYGFLLIVGVILIAGIGLNYVMTDGEWAASEPRIADPDAALGETPVQFLTTNPYDLLTTALFTISIILLAFSLAIPLRAHTKRSMGRMLPLAGSLGALGVLALVLSVIGTRVFDLLHAPALGALTEGTGILIAAGVLGTLALGVFLTGAHRAGMLHETRGLGWLIFSAHWALTGMYYYVTGGGDWVNMIFSYAAVFLLAYFAYQELVSRSLNEDNPSLRFAAIAVVIAAGVWYAFARIEILSQVLIETVTVHTVWLLELLGSNVQIGTDGQTGFQSAISYTDSVFPRTVIIILACTAIQSMMIFVAAAFAVKRPGTGSTKVFENTLGATSGAKTLLFIVPSLLVLAATSWFITTLGLPLVTTLAVAAFITLPVIALWGVFVQGNPLTLNQRRLLVLAVTIPIVYILNLTRNAGIIIMWADAWLERNWPGVVSAFQSLEGGTTSGVAFSIAHNWIGKGGSLLALIVIAFLVFKMLPEVLRALVGLLDLPRRRGPLEQYWRELRGHKDKPTPAKAPETV
jgi:archaeosortase A (PGF-CTERM-specific)